MPSTSRPPSPSTHCHTGMASNNNGNSFDSLLIRNLMARLHLRSPDLDSNSILSQTLDDFLLLNDPLSPGRDSDGSPLTGAGSEGRSRLSREEAKLEKEIVRIIRSGAALETLKPNSGQSVSIGDHNVCVGYHEEPGSEYRVWEWHGHVMLFDEEDGFCPEYVYGNYFERVPIPAGSKERGSGGEKDEGEEEKDAKSGLRGLIGDEMGSSGHGGQRVLHRNSLCSGLGK